MKSNHHRLSKVSKTLYKEIAIIIQNRIKNTKLSTSIQISSVSISKDFCYVKIFFSCLKENDFDFIKNTLFILNNSANFIKNTLKKNMRLRLIPKISFFYDDSIIKGITMSKIIEKLNV